MGRMGLVRTLKGVILFLAAIAAVFYWGALPQAAEGLGQRFPDLAWLAQPGIIAIGVSAIPIAVALALFWRICTDIGRDNSFCPANAWRLSAIGFCALIDSVYCAVGTVTFTVLAGTTMWIWGLTACVAGLGIAVAAFLLSHLVLKAAALKEDSDLTI